MTWYYNWEPDHCRVRSTFYYKCQMHSTNNLASESCCFTPEQIYPNVNMHRDSKEFRAWVWLEWTYPQGSGNTRKFTSHKLVFFDQLGVLKTFSTNQTAANKQVIHGLLESGLPCISNMVLHENTICFFVMERKYPKLPYILIIIHRLRSRWPQGFSMHDDHQQMRQSAILALLLHYPQAIFVQN